MIGLLLDKKGKIQPSTPTTYNHQPQHHTQPATHANTLNETSHSSTTWHIYQIVYSRP